MTLDVETLVALGVPAVGVLVYIGRSLEAMRTLTASNKDQGRRIGLLEDWKAAQTAVAEYKVTRTFSRAHGVPIPDDETPP